MLGQTSMFESPRFVIDKPVRLIELFGGISCQAQALKETGISFELYRYCDFDKFACQTHNEIMGTNDQPSDITKLNANDLGIIETDKYCYIMTYSFPCTDLSTAGKMAGMDRNSGTRSGLLWEVERLLKECNELPQVLLMENVTQVHGSKNKANFEEWCEFLSSLGYVNYWQDLNAKNYGFPQNRNRTFMVSLLGNYTYEFPKPVELEHKLQDLLEDTVDEKFFISDDMKKYITADNEKWTGNNSKCLINKEIASTINTGEGSRRCDASNYICSDLPNNCNLKRQMCNNLIQDGQVKEYDVIRHSYSTSRMSGCMKDIQQNNISPTLDTRCDCLGVVINTKNKRIQSCADKLDLTINGQFMDIYNQKNKTNGISGALLAGMEAHQGNIVYSNYRIRKLTPKECMRLMAVKDNSIAKITCSNAQKYKQAGNGIVVAVLVAIFGKMVDGFDYNKYLKEFWQQIGEIQC